MKLRSVIPPIAGGLVQVIPPIAQGLQHNFNSRWLFVPNTILCTKVKIFWKTLKYICAFVYTHILGSILMFTVFTLGKRQGVPMLNIQSDNMVEADN